GRRELAEGGGREEVGVVGGVERDGGHRAVAAGCDDGHVRMFSLDVICSSLLAERSNFSSLAHASRLRLLRFALNDGGSCRQLLIRAHPPQLLDDARRGERRLT